MKLKIKTTTHIYEYEASGETITIGRSSDNDFVIDLPDFSRRQCILTIKNNYAFIMDPGSKNGIKVDGKKIKPNEQVPIYKYSKIVLANNFVLLLPDGTEIREADELALDK